MSSPISSRGKRATRQALLARRDALTEEERAAKSQKIAVAADAMLVGTDGAVALYASKGSEVDTRAIDAAARARGLVVAYPRVLGDGLPLAFHAARREDLVPGPFGLREPAVDAPAVELGEIGVVFVPGLAFDRLGGRLGWGRGHYDATLAVARGARRVGLAFDCQIVDDLPGEPHDVRMHAILTEAATYTVGAGG